VVKCAASRPFDLIVMKEGYVAALELKALGADVDPEQREKQIRIAKDAGIDAMMLRQEERGRVSAAYLYGTSARFLVMLKEVLGDYLI